MSIFLKCLLLVLSFLKNVISIISNRCGINLLILINYPKLSLEFQLHNGKRDFPVHIMLTTHLGAGERSQEPRVGTDLAEDSG